jgi:hypothetical protein
MSLGGKPLLYARHADAPTLTSDDRTSASLFPSDHVRKREEPPRGLARTPSRRRVLAVELDDRATR